MKKPVDSVRHAEAIRLFCARASVAHPGFRLTHETAGPVAEICRRLEAVPLAIELAAARVAVLGVAEIAERLDARFRLLAEGPGGTAPQQETLRIALEWTYGLLSANDAALFRRMCVFTRATDVAGAEYVCAGEGLPRQAVAPGLASLVAKSLVACKAADLHIVVEPIRGYGCALLVESGESDMVGARHTDWWARRPIRLTLRTTEPLPEGASQ